MKLCDFVVKVECHDGLLEFAQECLEQNGCGVDVTVEVYRLTLVHLGLQLLHHLHIGRPPEQTLRLQGCNIKRLSTVVSDATSLLNQTMLSIHLCNMVLQLH